MDNKDDFDFNAIDLNEFLPLPDKEIEFSPALYEKNLSALSKHHPDIAELLDSVEIDKGIIKVIKSESGDFRMKYIKDSGEEVFIHSAHNPAACAQEAIDLLGRIEKEGIIVLFGFGLGYFAEEIFKKFENGHVLMIYEATLEIFKSALHLRDFSTLFESDRVKVILGEEGGSPLSIMSGFVYHIVNGKFWIVKHHPSVKINEEAYGKFHKMLHEDIIALNVQTATVVNIGSTFINSFFKNLPYLVRTHGVNKLKDILKGRNAIVAAAGPSLDKNMHLLKRAKGKAIIIAVEAALPSLIPCGIIPDIIVAIDPLEKNIDLFKDLPSLKETIFILLPQHTPEVISIYHGNMFMPGMTQCAIYQLVSRFFEDKGSIPILGGTVALFAFSVAQHLGADTIALVGQDLSFKEDKSHTKGFVDVSNKILQNALKTGDMTKVIDEYKGTLPWVDIFGENVLTRTDFLSFKTSFEKAVKNFSGKVINATEGGLPIQGAEVMRLMDFIDEYCENATPLNVYQTVGEIDHMPPECRIDELITYLETFRAAFEKIKKASQRILKYIRTLETLRLKAKHETKEFHNVLEKVESLVDQVKHPLLNVLVEYNMALEIYLHKAATQEIDEIDDRWEKLDKQFERGKYYYSELVKTINNYNKQLNSAVSALKREKNIDAILEDDSLSRNEQFYKAAIIHKKAGMFSLAARYLEKITDGQRQGGEKGISLQETFAEVYLKQFKFFDAKAALEKPEVRSEKIVRLMKTCNDRINAWERRRKEMEKLIERAEENYGGHLESGYFYFRIKDYDRAEKAYLKAVTGDREAVTGDGSQVTGHEPRVTRHGLSAAYYGLAHTYLSINNTEKAVDALEKAIEVDPKNPLFYKDLGFIAYQNGNISSAEAFFTRAIELSPKSVDLFKLLVDMYIGQGEIEKAIALYEDALLANPNHPAIQQELALLYKEMISKTGRA